MQEKSTIKQNISTYLSLKGVSEYQFYKETGVTRGVLSQNNGISEDNLMRFLNYAKDINVRWLLFGEGEMILQASPPQNNISFKNSRQVREPIVSTYRQEPTIDAQTIPLYSFEAMASVIAASGDLTPWIEDRIYIPNMPAVDGGTYVRGDSMQPIINSGDLVLFKRISINNVIPGQMYLISINMDGDSIIMAKYIQSSKIDEDHIQLVSHNKEQHPPKDIHKSSIQAIAIIKASIRYHL